MRKYKFYLWLPFRIGLILLQRSYKLSSTYDFFENSWEPFGTLENSIELLETLENWLEFREFDFRFTKVKVLLMKTIQNLIDTTGIEFYS